MRKIFLTVSILVTLFFNHLAWAEMKTSVNVMGLSFISSDFNYVDKTNFGFIGATLISNEKHPDPFMINMTGSYAVGNAVLSYLNFREMYFTVQIDAYSQFHIGRKLKNWSSLDADWNLGFFQPQFRWNPLSPENQGLTGVFWDHDESSWGLSLFASPLFLPDQGPGYEVKDGQFQDSNPWFNTPPQNIKFQGQIFPIDYNINKPETSDVVLQTVYAAQLRLGQKTGLFSNFSGAYKPSHQFALGYSGVLVTNRVKIDVTPKLYTENVYAADLGYRDNWGLAQLSFLYTQPHDPKFDGVANVPTFTNSLSWGPKFSFNFRPFEVGASFFDTQGGDVVETGPDVSADRPALTQRFLFRQAYEVHGKYSEVFMRMLKWDSMLQYTQSTKDQFRQIRFSNKIDIKGPWAFTSDILLIDTADDSTLNMNPYRNLDQFWIGASYDI